MPTEFPEVPLSAEQYIIIRDWNRFGSVRQVQKSTGHSFSMIRKTLLTCGICPTEQCQKVRELLNEGKTTAQIAEILGTTKKNVWNYLPYQRGSYTLPQSANAKKIAACRKRKTENLISKQGKEAESLE